MTNINNQVITECKEKLLTTKSNIMNRIKTSHEDFLSLDIGKDEVDLSVKNINESIYVSNNRRLKTLLTEIEIALARIQSGGFGLCEETSEPIEPQRLKAIPWTRLSIEGAEIREDLRRRSNTKA